MARDHFSLIGAGVYSLAEAARLTRIPSLRIRRWMERYSFKYDGHRHQSPPVIAADVGRDVGQLALTFSDLIEVRFLEAFLQHGVSLRSVRVAAARARELLQKRHPFSSRVFKTDGKDILTEIVRPGGVPDLLNLVRNQYELNKLVSPMLFAGIEFNSFDEAARWWPMTRKRSIVIDPAHSFGAPITVDGYVQTAILAASARAERSQALTARIYDVPVRAVKHSVEFERHFAA